MHRRDQDNRPAVQQKGAGREKEDTRYLLGLGGISQMDMSRVVNRSIISIKMARVRCLLYDSVGT